MTNTWQTKRALAAHRQRIQVATATAAAHGYYSPAGLADFLCCKLISERSTRGMLRYISKVWDVESETRQVRAVRARGKPFIKGGHGVKFQRSTTNNLVDNNRASCTE